MGLETATYISDLNSANPVAADFLNQADDHMRLIKSVLKATFPNVNAAVNPTPAEFNLLVGKTALVQTEVNDLTAAVTWANVPNANITQGSVTQHQAALSITESQISDFGSYATASHTHTLSVITDVTASAAELNTLDGILASTADLNRTQNLAGTPSRAVVTDGSGNLDESTVTATEVSRLGGVSSNIQAQLNAKATLALSTEQAASGASVSFTGISANAKQIIMGLDSVGVTGTANWRIEIGDSGGYETSNYNAVQSNIANGVSPTTSSSGTSFPLTVSVGASDVVSGQVILTLEDSTNNVWSLKGTLGAVDGGTARIFVAAGSKGLSAVLDRIQIVSGVGTFNAGGINIAVVT